MFVFPSVLSLCVGSWIASSCFPSILSPPACITPYRLLLAWILPLLPTPSSISFWLCLSLLHACCFRRVALPVSFIEHLPLMPFAAFCSLRLPVNLCSLQMLQIWQKLQKDGAGSKKRACRLSVLTAKATRILRRESMQFRSLEPGVWRLVFPLQADQGLFGYGSEPKTTRIWTAGFSPCFHLGQAIFGLPEFWPAFSSKQQVAFSA